MAKVCKVSCVVVVAALVAACGGGGGPDGSATQSTAVGGASAVQGIVLDAPQTVGASSRIRLSWRVQGAAPSRIAVWLQPAAGEAFAPVEQAEVSGDSAQFWRGAAWKLDFPTARVRVEGCDALQRCVQSNEQPLLDALIGGLVQVTPDTAGFNAVFANRVALSADGQTLAAAAPTDLVDEATVGRGSVYLFRRGSDGEWTQQARLHKFHLPGNFGDPMALSGDGRTLAVGAYTDSGTVGGPGAPEMGSNGDWRGAVVVYVRNAQDQWVQQNYLKAADPRAGEMLGFRLALSHDGSRLLAAALTRLLMFERDAAGAWRQARVFEGRDASRTIAPSGAIAISANGRSVAVSAGGFDVQPDGARFPVFGVNVYQQCPCSEGWRQAADLRSSKPPYQSRGYIVTDFGATSLSFSDDGRTLAVGAPLDPGDATDTGQAPPPYNTGSPDAGAVYVFAADGNGVWRRQAFLKARGAPTQDYLGDQVALSGDGRVLAVKACGHAAQAEGLRRNHRADAMLGQQDGVANCFWGGSAYVFERGSDDEWRHVAAAIGAPGERTSFLFFSIALSADAHTLGLGLMSYASGNGIGRVVVH